MKLQRKGETTMSIIIKPVRFTENGFMTEPFALGGEGAEGLDPAVKYRSCLQNWVIDTGSEVILVDTGVPENFPFGEPTEDATIYVGRKIKPYIEALADLGDGLLSITVASLSFLLNMQKTSLLVAVENLNIAGRVASAAEKSVYSSYPLRSHDALHQLNHLSRYPEPWHEDGYSRRIRHKELRGDATDGRVKRHELSVAKRRVSRQHHWLPLNSTGNRFVVVDAGRRAPDERAVEAADAEQALEMLLDRADSHQQEYGRRSRFLPLDV
jgi:hypothetical protein